MIPITELMGAFATKSYSTNYSAGKQQGSTISGLSPTQHKSKFGRNAGFSNMEGNCVRMYTWQRGVYEALKHQDVYVVASPGGGKTLPYMCYWSNNILGLNTMEEFNPSRDIKNWQKFVDTIHNIFTNPARVQKLLICVPTRTLCDQTVVEMKEKISRLLYQSVELILEGSLPVNNAQSQAIFNRLGGNYLSGLWAQRTQLFRQHDAASAQDKNRDLLRTKIEGIDAQMNEIIDKSIQRMLASGQNSLIAARSQSSPFGNPKTAIVTIAIYESAKFIIKDIKNSLGLMVIDEAHLMQQHLDKDDADSRRINLADSLYSIFKELSSTNAKLCFLSGTENPSSAKDLIEYLKICFSRNIKQVNAPRSAGNMSNISVVPNDSLLDYNSLVDIITNTREHNNLIVLFSKRKINQLAEDALRKSSKTTLQHVDKGKYQNRKWGAPSATNFKYQKPTTNSDVDNMRNFSIGGANDINTKSEINTKNLTGIDITNPVLRQCVQAGFGYIYRVTDEELQRDPNLGKDIQIVANLFKEKKIKTLLATDAVGIGVNIDVKKLYIPEVVKRYAGKTVEIPTAELSQLLNRAGRAAFNYSSIQTPEKNIPKVIEALSAGPTEFAKTATIIGRSKNMCRRVDWFKSIWNNQIKRTP